MILDSLLSLIHINFVTQDILLWVLLGLYVGVIFNFFNFTNSLLKIFGLFTGSILGSVSGGLLAFFIFNSNYSSISVRSILLIVFVSTISGLISYVLIFNTNKDRAKVTRLN